MTINRTSAGKLLRVAAFRQLFIEELGWDHCALQIAPIALKGVSYALDPIAEKHGFAVFVVMQTLLPDYPTRREVERQLAKSVHEHLIIFCNAAKTEQVWQWVKREVGRPAACREHHYAQGQQGEALLQKLEHLVFALEDEGTLGIGAVAAAVKRALDIERVTKRFYDRFQAEHRTFLSLIDGLDGLSRDWYASFMLNRLMFVYFIQKKGFLNDDKDYLPNKLKEVQARRGKDKFQTFYRAFLLKLFHDGLGSKPPRSVAISALIGNVPYLNGGLFDPHQLERDNPKIDIPDAAFERIFAFFDAYQWHLDDRPVRNDTEINPDVLGYIFEKYINQKQMGAYYTKEDITEYISKSTVIPFLLQRAQENCKVAFSGESSVWLLLARDPARYIYSAMKVGVVDGTGATVPETSLPAFVQNGMRDPMRRMLERAYNVGEAEFQTADGERGTLPTETWREYVERRRRCLASLEKLASGSVNAIEDLITLNLDLRQFMQDIIDTCAGPELLRAIWQAIVGRADAKGAKATAGITILDPACGSGAFLFSALGVLEPLYEACLDRMASFVADARRLGRDGAYQDFEQILNSVASERHPSRRYFIYKTIILNNLFGVDIMPEAVEICKLRLFLKLVSQAETGRQLEPLPDIDFNIRAGNTLVGYATKAQFDASNTLASDQDHRDKVKASTAALASLFSNFRAQQIASDGKVTAAEKRGLQDGLDALRLELDRYLAGEYGVAINKKKEFSEWREANQPFHWFADFFAVMERGGFDVIIGNPPYVELGKVRGYSVSRFRTAPCGNLYCPMLERFGELGSAHFKLGVIVPLSLSCTERMSQLRELLQSRLADAWISHFSGDANPSKLFDGVKLRLNILIGAGGNGPFRLWSSAYLKWFAAERPRLFSSITYELAPKELWHLGLFPKLGNVTASAATRKILQQRRLGLFASTRGKTVYVHRVMTMFVKAFDFVPYFRNETDGVKKSEDYKPYQFATTQRTETALAILNSTTFMFYFVTFGDCFHCGKEFVLQFPADIERAEAGFGNTLPTLGKRLMRDLKSNAIRRSAMSERTGAVEYDEFWPSKSKAIIDEIDTVLAQQYGFSDDELDYVVNYDIKYRIGGGNGSEDDE